MQAPRRPPGWPPTRVRLSAVASGLYHRGPVRVAEVDVYVSGVVVTGRVTLPSAGHPTGAVRVLGPFRRGTQTVEFSSAALGFEVAQAAVEAAEYADARGWLAT